MLSERSWNIIQFLRPRGKFSSVLLYLNSLLLLSRSLIPVKVIQVIPPALPQSSPVKISVINSPLTKPLLPPPPPLTPSHPPQPSSTPVVVVQDTPVTTNGPQTTSMPSKTASSPAKKATPRSQLPVSPISFEAKLSPSGYQYVVESLRHSGQQFTVSTKQLR